MHSDAALETTQVTASGSFDETHPDGLDELRPMATTCNSVAAGPTGDDHGTEMNPSEAESYTVIIRYDAVGGMVASEFHYWRAGETITDRLDNITITVFESYSLSPIFVTCHM
jgi:hypothetical protein